MSYISISATHMVCKFSSRKALGCLIRAVLPLKPSVLYYDDQICEFVGFYGSGESLFLFIPLPFANQNDHSLQNPHPVSSKVPRISQHVTWIIILHYASWKSLEDHGVTV